MRRIVATAPARLDLAGGTLDIWPIHLVLPAPGVTVNVALDTPSRAEVGPADGTSIRLASADRAQSVTYPHPAALAEALGAGDAPLALLSRAVQAVAPEGGLTLETDSRSPSGAGLGASSSLLVSVLGALHAALGREDALGAERLVGLAVDLETSLLGRPTGYQDFYPPLLGGCLALEGRPGGVVAERLDVDLGTLAARLRLVWTGEPHVSGDTNWNTVRAFLDGEPATRAAILEIAERSRTVREQLRQGDLDGALASVVAEGSVRRRMAPGVTTPTIEALDGAVRQAGAVGTKILGAGGGGCVLVVLPGPDVAAVDAVLARGPWRALPLALAAEGLSIRAG
jgi:D-glycero-alpha-D-manno-heptose-7-phosphate kinase